MPKPESEITCVWCGDQGDCYEDFKTLLRFWDDDKKEYSEEASFCNWQCAMLHQMQKEAKKMAELREAIDAVINEVNLPEDLEQILMKATL